MVGTVLEAFHQPGYHRIFGIGTDQLYAVAVFDEKADIYFADFIAQGILFDLVAEGCESVLGFLYFFDQVADVMYGQIRGQSTPFGPYGDLCPQPLQVL